MKNLFYLLFLLLLACQQNPSSEQIINQSIASYGFDKVEGKTISFSFRDKDYSVSRSASEYKYTRSFLDDSLGFIKDELINSKNFTRSIDGNPQDLSEEFNNKFTGSVNSVLYFFQLPLTLNDPAVLKKYLGKSTIHGMEYHQIEIRFKEENGGEDFEDVFLYWINEETHLIDFLAYSYLTDGGGVRFRKAINRRKIDGITVQDYINYKPAKKNTALSQMLQLFLENQLIELSRIENKNVKVSVN